jgi:hypothetical protein
MNGKLEAYETIKNVLFKQVAKRGMQDSLIPHYLRDLTRSIFVRPGKNHSEINEHMHHLGWKEIEVDYHIFELAKACLNSEKQKGMAA